MIHGFELIREQEIPELKTKAFFYKHDRTGAELLSLVNDDENKVFGITFRTPPKDSTGVPHILEHSVLCGSRKYPVKEPFVELLKGSLQTFLNAMTYPDKTCYPVASQNLKDFYHLLDVYLDAVFYPRLTEFIFQQEGWHYELEKEDGPLRYKGVVFNEMKGAYSSPDNLIADYSLRSLFPENAYGFDSGGDPKQIPNLTFKQFKEFHERYYHPSNSRIYFYGDDDPEQRLFLVNEYLKEFERIEVDSVISIQRTFKKPHRVIRTYPAGKQEGHDLKGMLTLNWMFSESRDRELNLAMHILEYILLGMPGSPLRKALIESNLGEDLTGTGLGSETRQMHFSTGLKGIDPDNSDRIQDLIIQTLNRLIKEKIDIHTIEAAINSIEFGLRENNTGRFPRGLLLMLRSLNQWLYDGDPLAMIAFEDPLKSVKAGLTKNPSYFEDMIQEYFIQNPHRTTLIMKPDPGLEAREKEAEENKLHSVKKEMSPTGLQGIVENALQLKEIQEKPDSPEALAAIPMLKLSDLDRNNKEIPLEILEEDGKRIFYHDLFTNGIAYMDMGFDLGGLPREYLPYIRLFGRALLEMGTEKEDYVTITQRISRKTGGIFTAFHTSTIKNMTNSGAWLFLRGKAMYEQTEEMLDILRDVLFNVRLDNKNRFRQILLEAKAREEQKLIPSGHQVINIRLRSHYQEADWVAEQISGLSYLFFLRRLVNRLDEDWDKILNDLSNMHRILLNRKSMLINVTQDEKGWSDFGPVIMDFLDEFSSTDEDRVMWSREKIPSFEGLTIPSLVNYVGKGANLYEKDYHFHGSAQVICRFLRNSWLWDRVRVRGGAYGAFCLFDRLSGTLTFISYRDPNLFETIDVFDQSATYLRNLDLSEDELTKGIIGSIGDLDDHKLPDAKGYQSMVHQLSGETDGDRQRMREEILGTTSSDFRAFADVLENVRKDGIVKVLGSREVLQATMEERPGWLHVTEVL